MNAAVIIHPDGTLETVIPVNGKKFKLKQLQEIVGGYIEIVPSHTKGFVLVVDEDGKLKHKKRNYLATRYANIAEDDYIVGNALHVKRELID